MHERVSCQDSPVTAEFGATTGLQRSSCTAQQYLGYLPGAVAILLLSVYRTKNCYLSDGLLIKVLPPVTELKTSRAM